MAILATVTLCASCAQASWYWPDSLKVGKSDKPRLSELMEPATTNIDAAADFAAEGKIKEAQECYRAAIAALNKIEAENPERAATPEFATVRNKRAYVNAALDSMLLQEARENAKAVAVTDTTELEMRLVLKPWKEFLPTYAALTNADRLVTMRLALVETPWVKELLDFERKGAQADVCASNRAEIAKSVPELNAARAALQKVYGETTEAVTRMERFSETAATPAGVRVFDVSKKDVRKGVAACEKAWPQFGDAIDRTSRSLDGLRAVALEIGAKKSFPEIAKDYVKHVKGRHPEDAEALVHDFGHLRACQMMLGELDAAGSGVVHRGVLYKIQTTWGGEAPEVPEQENEHGLVKDDGDARPEVESQIEAFMERERKNTEKIKKSAKKAKVTKGVQREIDKLLGEDPKSRRARMLQVGEDLRNGDTASAKERIRVLLDEKPKDGPALNMLAAIQAAEGDLKAAENTLDQAIQSNPRDYHAYYNMANVYLQRGNVDGARRYYETGRSFAGPKDEELEKAIKRK